MIDAGARNFMSLTAILLAVVFGFVAFVSERVERSVQQRHAAITTLANTQRTAPAADRIVSYQAKADALKAWIQHGNAPDESRLYARLLALGDRESLVIERIDPTSRTAPDGGFVSTVGFTIEAVGAYERVARFLGAIESEVGFAHVVSFSLTPIEGDAEELVQVVLETAHLRFHPSALANATAAIQEADE